jgi:hypothetical protein
MMVVASSPEHLRGVGKREHERGKAEGYGAVLAMVSRNTVELRWHLEQAEVAMRLTSGSIEATG